jgi:small subunit ribosomal protein S20
MPVIRGAKKKLKVDRKRESSNKKAEAHIDMVVKKAQKKPTPTTIQAAFKAIDKGVKKEIYHKNKAARIKSRLSKLIAKKFPSQAKKEVSKPTKVKAEKKKKK